MRQQSKDRAISIRLSQVMLKALDEYALMKDIDRTQVVRDAVAQYLGLSTDSIDERLNSMEEQMSNLNERLEELADRVSHCVEFLGKTSRK